MLAPILGTSLASIVFGCIFFSIWSKLYLTGTLAGQIVMEGF